MDVMRELPDKAFELAIVDPPYGLGMEEGNSHWIRQKFTGKGKSWDGGIPNADYFKELNRVSVEQIVWGGNYFVEYLPPSMGWICWFKTNECVGRQFSEFELAYSSFQKAARIVERKPFQKGGTRIHPTQKPVEVYKWLLQNYAKPGDRILDTHSGSGSLALACDQLGFDFLAIELDEEYYKASCKRLHEQQTQLSLFSGAAPKLTNKQAKALKAREQLKLL
jgi:site-specific DNA-methyltransferase (adenine-specific)